MTPTLGILVAIYAIARLVQEPLAMYAPGSGRWIFSAIVSAIAIIGIGICAVDLLLSGVSAGARPADNPLMPHWTGITQTPTSYLVRVRVRPFPMRAKRFPLTTSLAVMQAWRNATETKDRAVKPETPDAGTLEADVARYLEQWGSGKHPITVLQRTRYLQAWAAAFPRRFSATLTTPEIERQLKLWQKQGLPVTVGTPQPHLTDATMRKVRQALYQLFAVLYRGTGRANPVDDVPAGSDPDPDPGGQPMAVIRRCSPRCRAARRRRGVTSWRILGCDLSRSA